ncbi:MAG: hypothetical protein J6O00_10560 [Clostridiales bacterium]|nr:hypothetical protein [Clostridiales bacterium]
MATPGFVQARYEATKYFEMLAEKSNESFYSIENDSVTFSEGLSYTTFFDKEKTKKKAQLVINLEVWDASDFNTQEIAV